jgi:hypothetical protein
VTVRGVTVRGATVRGATVRGATRGAARGATLFGATFFFSCCAEKSVMAAERSRAKPCEPAENTRAAANAPAMQIVTLRWMVMMASLSHNAIVNEAVRAPSVGVA